MLLEQVVRSSVDRVSEPATSFGEVVEFVEGRLSVEDLPLDDCFEHDGRNSDLCVDSGLEFGQRTKVVG